MISYPNSLPESIPQQKCLTPNLCQAHKVFMNSAITFLLFCSQCLFCLMSPYVPVTGDCWWCLRLGVVSFEQGCLVFVLQLLQLQLQSTSALMIVWRLLEDGLLEEAYTPTGLCVSHYGPMHCMLLSSFSCEHLGQIHVDSNGSVMNNTRDYFRMPQYFLQRFDTLFDVNPLPWVDRETSNNCEVGMAWNL